MLKRILVVDDEEGVRYSFERFLDEPGYKVSSTGTGSEALAQYAKEPFDLVVLDVRLPDMSGIEVLHRIKDLDPKAVVLIITAYGTTNIAIEATKKGAYDYILKPFNMPDMKRIIHEALTCSRLMRTQVVIQETQAEQPSGDRIIGSSPVMQEVYKLIGRVAASDINILIRGETGTGKELVARAIYHHSNRSANTFLAVNCAAIPETLLESELFGYERGAFTGAVRRKIGKFEQADGGTIFLDEIGDMSLSTQSKILRIVQEGCFERLGGEQKIQVDVRVIAATNANLEKAIEDGRFREDLYYRLNVVTIALPPLRSRQQDIPALVDYFLTRHCTMLRKERIPISNRAMAQLIGYHWPGNIRELENVIKRAIVLCKGNAITEEYIAEGIKPSQENPDPACPSPVEYPDLKRDMKIYNGALHDRVMSETERMLIEKVLDETGGNQVRTARILGISRFMLRDRLARYNLKKRYPHDR
ncbi:MAG: sigma-54-dependent transcriptional regulator [bacterium]